MGKTFKDRHKDSEIVKRPRKRRQDKRRKQLDEIAEDDEVVRNGHQYRPDSPERLSGRLGSQDEYDTHQETNEAADQGIDIAPRESTCDVRDKRPKRQDESGTGRGDNSTD